MSYYMRFILDGGQEVSLPEIVAEIRRRDPRYALTEACELVLDGTPIAALELNARGGELFDEEIAELIEEIEGLAWREESGDTPPFRCRDPRRRGPLR
jgi:hypothetical protein